MQAVDAEDLAQQVLVSISQAIERFDPDRQDAKFRTWLRRITHNAILNALTRGLPDRGSGDEAVEALLKEHPHRCDRDLTELEMETRRQAFLRAAESIRADYAHATWQAFWLTAVHELPVAEVANQLNCTVGSVYASRCRIMKRLREEVQRLQ